jgi:5-formyltetrahydrofolate cyclo-ligase
VLELGGVRSVALYAAISGELDPSLAYPSLVERAIAVLYPRIESDAPPVLSFRLTPPAALEPGRFGVLSPPATSQPAPLGAASAVLVPGLAFDRAGHRLGYGRGYYDAALAAAPAALRVGFCHEFQLTDALPRRTGDEAVDLIVTPEGVRTTGARPGFPAFEVPR